MAIGKRGRSGRAVIIRGYVLEKKEVLTKHRSSAREKAFRAGVLKQVFSAAVLSGRIRRG